MSKGEKQNVPLAERVRPRSLSEFEGQEHLVGEGKPIRLMLEKDNLSSFIMWGPPGSGKTTIARIISEESKSEFYQINAVSSGVKEVRQIIEKGRINREYNKETILFIDEIHRFNKGQQDALLGSVEKGDIILIGATTENPSFEVIPALRSRVKIYVLNELNRENLDNILDHALSNDTLLSKLDIKEIDREFLFFVSGGDARILLSTLESVINSVPGGSAIIISKEAIENILQKKNILYDKGGEEHYNVISAFIKSLRGSDPDAALYWMARMLEAGEDPKFIARRMIILASEDIGNASPNALLLANAAFDAVNKIGMPEARIILAQCATYLASSPKSNAAYTAVEAAFEKVRQTGNLPVPMHLRNAPTKLMKSLGYSDNYKYPHDYERNFIEELYFPEELSGSQFYFPSDNGFEVTIKERLTNFWKKFKKY